MGIKADIVAVLSSRDATLTDFTLFGHRIRGADYRRIAGAITNGHIQIIQAEAVADTEAGYDRVLNCFVVGANPSASLIVHEATHAINDWHGRTLSPVEDEALAYVAQMIFTCREMPAVQMGGLSNETNISASRAAMMCRIAGRDCNTATIGYATIIAATLRVGETPSDELLADFRAALTADPAVRSGQGDRIYNHIERTPIPAAYLTEIRGEVAAS